MYYWSFWGMNAIWWFFWVALVVVFFSLATPVSRGRAREFDNPLSILQRRYAGGQMTTEEYQERKAQLQKDLQEASSTSTFRRRRLEQRHV
ncbi:MAG TPA: SHOCT domain-containing protein [Polyangia bacterium]|nr:SHOCT domain-containing protein [Polyangia bacterium]